MPTVTVNESMSLTRAVQAVGADIGTSGYVRARRLTDPHVGAPARQRRGARCRQCPQASPRPNCGLTRKTPSPTRARRRRAPDARASALDGF
jgi:hypothetical protein